MMAGIDKVLLDNVLARIAVSPAPTFDALAQTLRTAFPEVHITVCSEDDMPARAKPAAENAAGYIYYVASSEHCLSLTNDAETATGIVVALRDDD